MSTVVFEKASTHLAPPTYHQHRSAKANQTDTALHSSVRQTSTALRLRTRCQVRCADGPFESTVRSYFRVTELLEALSRTVFKLLQITGHMFAVDRGKTLVRNEPLNWGV